MYGEKLRSLFTAGPDWYQIGYDYASLENRIQAHYCIPYPTGPEYAVSLLANKPFDSHTLMGQALGIPRDSAKSVVYACVPKLSEVLTPKGWINISELVVGDVVFSYNTQTCKIEKDVVLQTHYFKDKEVISFKNQSFEFLSTPDHRWYCKKQYQVKGQRRLINHEFITTKALNSTSSVQMSGPYVGGDSSITPEESSFIAWLISDGFYSWSKRSETTSSSNGTRKQVTGSISQSINKFYQEVETSLDAVSAIYSISQKAMPNGNHVKSYNLSSVWLRPFLDRVLPGRVPQQDVNWCEFVLSLSAPALKSFVSSFHLAEGTTGTGAITQNYGNIHEGIALAVYLLGNKVSISDKGSKCSVINSITRGGCFFDMQKIKKESRGVQDTYCITTRNSTFVMRQGQTMTITGNCLYGAAAAKLQKMLGLSPEEAEKMYNKFWDAVPALKELKQRVETYWEGTDRDHIVAIDGRLLRARSAHSLLNLLFQGSGAIAVKWATVLVAQNLDAIGILGDPFKHSDKEGKIFQMIVYHKQHCGFVS